MKQKIKNFFKENKSVIVAVLTVFLLGTLMGTMSQVKAQTKEITEKFVRFHIVANSNSDADQNVKMKVRETIFTELDFSHISSKREAISYFREHQTDIENIAKRVLMENGFSYGVNVAVGKREFPVREYSDFVLPAGTYDAISVVLGAGEGENFFCVMYPSLCKIEGVTESTTDNYQVLNNILTEEETSAITGNKQQIVYKFKIIEFFENIF